MIKPILEPNCEGSGKNAIKKRSSFILNQRKGNSLQIMLQANSAKQWRKRVVYPICLFYVWTTLELKVQDLYAFRRNQTFCSSRSRQETNFWRKQDHHWSGPFLHFIRGIQNTTSAENGVEHQKAVNLWKIVDKGKKVVFINNWRVFSALLFKQKAGIQKRRQKKFKVAVHW